MWSLTSTIHWSQLAPSEQSPASLWSFLGQANREGISAIISPPSSLPFVSTSTQKHSQWPIISAAATASGQPCNHVSPRIYPLCPDVCLGDSCNSTFWPIISTLRFWIPNSILLCELFQLGNRLSVDLDHRSLGQWNVDVLSQPTHLQNPRMG